MSDNEKDTVVHVHKVEIKVNSNQDPARIAAAVKHVLQDLAATHKLA